MKYIKLFSSSLYGIIFIFSTVVISGKYCFCNKFPVDCITYICSPAWIKIYPPSFSGNWLIDIFSLSFLDRIGFAKIIFLDTISSLLSS